MPKKIIRVKLPKAEEILKLLARDIHIVMANKAVFFGVIHEVENSKVYFSDKIRNKQVLELNEILEIMTDEIHQF